MRTCSTPGGAGRLPGTGQPHHLWRERHHAVRRLTVRIARATPLFRGDRTSRARPRSEGVSDGIRPTASSPIRGSQTFVAVGVELWPRTRGSRWAPGWARGGIQERRAAGQSSAPSRDRQVAARSRPQTVSGGPLRPPPPGRLPLCPRPREQQTSGRTRRPPPSGVTPPYPTRAGRGFRTAHVFASIAA